jgi:hypothetical protein
VPDKGPKTSMKEAEKRTRSRVPVRSKAPPLSADEHGPMQQKFWLY